MTSAFTMDFWSCARALATTRLFTCLIGTSSHSFAFSFILATTSSIALWTQSFSCAFPDDAQIGRQSIRIENRGVEKLLQKGAPFTTPSPVSVERSDHL